MPVWHKATQKWVTDGKLVVLGITQEQHADRCRLFAQWQNFEWPILWDPINVLESAAVPIIVAIDEHGIVRSTRPRPETLESEFLNVTFEDDRPRASGPQKSTNRRPPARPERMALRVQAERSKTAQAYREWADACVLWGGESEIGSAIEGYSRAIQSDANDANAMFRLGVAFRLRHDSSLRQPSDFQTAVHHWERALAQNPNQYIWRRRIQQYGPRLDKPYSFYDWVDQARREITARGESPVELSIDPYGAELAQPVRTFVNDPLTEASPDPEGKIQRDTAPLIHSEVTMVPSEIKPGGAIRVHIALSPNTFLAAHWNNEADPLEFWIDRPEGWQISQQSHVIKPPEDQPTSTETRRIDFEVQAPPDASGILTLSAFALYFVCEDENGSCLYLRKDVSVQIKVSAVAE